jgi:hypothetical protein
VDKVLEDESLKKMIDECWRDGAKIYIKHDPAYKDIPGFEQRTFVPPKRRNPPLDPVSQQVPSEG